MNEIAQLEGLLFAVGHEGIQKDVIMQALEIDEAAFTDLLNEYNEILKEEHRGFELIQFDEHYKLITKQSLHELIAKTLAFNKTRHLSQAALETLAIIAYKQPITRLEIEEVRGVNSDMMCRRLEAMDLIRECGRADSVGKPILYEVTPAFMDVFKLTSLDELPEIKIEMMDDNHDLFK